MALALGRALAGVRRAAGQLRASRVVRLASSAAGASGAPPAVAFDIDGVLIRGKGNVLKGAHEALQMLADRRLPCAFLTNGGGMSEKEKAAELSDWFGVRVDPDDIVLSHTPLRTLAPKYQDQYVLSVGRGRCPDVLKEYGFEKVIDVPEVLGHYPLLYPALKGQFKPRNELPAGLAAIMVMSDPAHMSSEIQVVIDFLRSNGVPGEPPHDGQQQVGIYFCNSDLLYGAEWHVPRFGGGAFRHCVESLYLALEGRPLRSTLYGKPCPAQFRYTEQVLERAARRIGAAKPTNFWLVGDNPAADIAGANASGWRSVLVETGVYKAGTMPEHTPTAVRPGVLQAVQHILGAAHS
eukprot:tig00020563_g11229.t1